MLRRLAEKIIAADQILLSTHRQCDGDGLGSEVALYYALKKMKKKVRILNVDATAKKYQFLGPENIIENFETSSSPLTPVDLVLIFDTNDQRLLEPLYAQFQAQAKDIIFIDHHPILKEGPPPTHGSFIDTDAASTGEMTYKIIQALGVSLDEKIARGLYTSIAFDTQLFRFVRSSSQSHLIAAELLKYNIQPEDIHIKLFGNYSVQKMKFLAHALSQIEYFSNGQLAILKLHAKDLLQFGIDNEDSNDVVDLLMNIESLQAAALLREEGSQKFKLSLRSKGHFEVLEIAESLGGGGHLFSSGAYLTGSFDALKTQVLNALTHSLLKLDKKNESA
jgi:phosphoesterase RecJ-like protein